MGISYAEMEKNGILLPVQKIDITYLKPAFYDDCLRLKTTLISNISARIIFQSELFDPNNTLLTKASVSLVFLDAQTRKPMRPPRIFKEFVKKDS